MAEMELPDAKKLKMTDFAWQEGIDKDSGVRGCLKHALNNDLFADVLLWDATTTKVFSSSKCFVTRFLQR